ncbi:MAG: hypothetical protein ACHQT6_01030 [Candidatus Acidiferrales bacterium]
MLTFFSTAKPFTGHSAVIQRNGLESWKRLHPDVEVILFGDDAGAAEVCRELGLRHEPAIERRENGTKGLRSIFGRAQKIARHDILCYVNCDIILTSDFLRAIEALSARSEPFLMVGRRWDVDVTLPLDFSQPVWQEAIVQRAQREGFQRLYYNIDYFAFRRRLYSQFPDLFIGRNWWDQWLVWQAGAAGVPVIDVSEVVCAVHQNHDYSYHPQGMTGVWTDDATQENFRRAGGWSHLHTIEDATYRLTSEGLQRNRGYWLAPAKRRVRRVRRAVRTFLRTRLWHPLLDRTRPLRLALGLRQNVLNPLRRRNGPRRHWLDQ